MGDTLATALDTGLQANQSLKIVSGIANALDVDLQRVDLAAGEVLTTNVSAATGYTYLRIFDAAGNMLSGPTLSNPGSANATNRFVAPAGSSYYVGISGYPNGSYNPGVAGSGSNAAYIGAYTLNLQRLGTGASHLSGGAVVAASGTAANAALGSANTGQVITLRSPSPPVRWTWRRRPSRWPCRPRPPRAG